jgi:hypothetical protein
VGAVIALDQVVRPVGYDGDDGYGSGYGTISTVTRRR